MISYVVVITGDQWCKALVSHVHVCCKAKLLFSNKVMLILIMQYLVIMMRFTFTYFM